MKNSHRLLGVVVFMFVFVTLVCGCTGTQTGPVTGTVTPTATAAEQESTPEQEWKLWREGAGQTLSPLGDYQVFTPNVNAQEFKTLKIEMISDVPITVMFFNKSELNDFKEKLSTNQGEYTPVSRYDDVKSEVFEESSDEYLSIVLYNPGKKLALVERANIWYKE